MIKKEIIYMKEKILVSIVIELMISLMISPVLAKAESLIDFERREESSEDKVERNSSEINQKQEALQPREDAQTISESANDLSENSEEEQNRSVPILQEMMIIKNQTTENFIEEVRELARKIACDYDLYASVMIAQAILESASGSSTLATAPNYNLFGIKGDYNGMTVVMKTQEEDGEGALYTINSEFRKYSSLKECLEDYACLLKNGLVGNPEFYKGAWKSETMNYQEATAFLTGRYATDSQYAEKLDQLIFIYELSAYDEFQENNTIQPENLSNRNVKETMATVKKIKNVRRLVTNKSKKKRIRDFVENVTSYIDKIYTISEKIGKRILIFENK
ncbi:hypothetical protein CI088_03565 [Enterococcus plantarum]|uniref:Mannosyl-glycoprotein endo-beta-N-acetylglucosamidase-like domain-containing protein n=2 Tax=Enterococcus plantarum TaxID=1077675 RepID=A0A2W3Z8H0_9ENTE|nr:hypothetical protein CI088_03565 [Enterococcus plantarum]